MQQSSLITSEQGKVFSSPSSIVHQDKDGASGFFPFNKNRYAMSDS